MKEIRKFPTPFPHSTTFLRILFSEICSLVGIKKAETPFVSRVSAVYPGSDLNRYERNVHRILSPYNYPLIPIESILSNLHNTAECNISPLHFPTPLSSKISLTGGLYNYFYKHNNFLNLKNKKQNGNNKR
jgi:hypothetical protein